MSTIALQSSDRSMAKQPKPIDAVLRMAIINSDESLYQIAKDCEISYGSLHRFVSGERDIRFQAAVKLARYLQLELVPWVRE